MKLKFELKQRARLRREELSEAQVNALEAALPVCRAWLREQPRMQDVRDELQKLSNAVKHLENVISRLRGAEKHQLATHEAWTLVFLSADPQQLDDALSVLKAAAQSASESLPEAQRRPTSASFLPVARMHRALLDGFAKEKSSKQSPAWKPDFELHNPPEGMQRDEFLRGLRPPLVLGTKKALLRERIKVSRASLGRFRTIVRICYEAMGFGTPDNPANPERAIRNYMDHLALRETQADEDRAKISKENPPEGDRKCSPGRQRGSKF